MTIINPVVSHKLSKYYLSLAKCKKGKLPLDIIHYIFGYIMNEGQGTIVYLTNFHESRIQYVFLRYHNVIRGTVIIYVPRWNKSYTDQINMNGTIIVKDSQIYVDGVDNAMLVSCGIC